MKTYAELQRAEERRRELEAELQAMQISMDVPLPNDGRIVVSGQSIHFRIHGLTGVATINEAQFRAIRDAYDQLFPEESAQ